MRRIILCIVAILAVATIASAGTISKTGVSQGDLVKLLTKTVTMVNTLKAQHNVLANKLASEGTFANYSATARGSVVSTTDLSLRQ